MSSIVDFLPELVALRRDIHAHPERGFCEVRTAARIAEELRKLGLEVHEGLGTTGLVGVLKGRRAGTRTLGLRADMDALSIEEKTNLPWASTNPGTFHGCGHDGHLAMLLGAARVLAADPDFAGTLNFIFQPAEEGLGGARVMIEQGLFTRFPCDRVYALHNWPGLPAGTISTRPGAIMGAADKFTIKVKGKGGHAAMPQATPDAILASASLVQQLNTIVSRAVPPSANAVLSVTQIHAGHAHNVIPEEVTVVGTVRTFDPVVQDRIEERLREVLQGVATSFGVKCTVDYDRYYPATINDAEAAADALQVAATVARAELAPEPAATSEDFAFMLQQRPGAYLWLGQGTAEHAAPLHNPHYDFNDSVMETGIRLHVALAKHWLK